MGEAMSFYDPQSDIEAILERIDKEIAFHKAQIDRLLSSRHHIAGALAPIGDYGHREEPQISEEDLSYREVVQERIAQDAQENQYGGDEAIPAAQESPEAPGDQEIEETGNPSTVTEDEAPEASQEPASEPKVPAVAKKRRKQLTVEQLRDFIVDDLTPRLEEDRFLFINGRPEVGKQGKAPGYFTVGDLAEELGFHSTTLHVLLPKIAHMLDSTSYKAGKQYRYHPPEAKVNSITQVPNVRPVSDPVPGTGRPLGAGNTDTVKLLKECREQGFKIDANGRGHMRVTNPRNGKFVIVSNTPSDVNAMKQARRDLKKIGGRF